MAKKKQQSSAERFRAGAEKYVGRIQIEAGPVPLQRMHRPYTQDERNGPDGAHGKDLRGEARTSSNPRRKKK